MLNDVGIVHTGRDREVAAQIASSLRRHGLDVWIDPETLIRGRMQVEAVAEALESSKVILYLCSPGIEHPVWVKSELEFVQARYNGSIHSDQVILPVIVEKCKLPSPLARLTCFDLTVADFGERLDELAFLLEKKLRKRTVFVCHSSRDKDQVDRIIQSLRRRRNLAVWYDSQSMMPAVLFGERA